MWYFDKNSYKYFLFILILVQQFIYVQGDDFDENEPLKEVINIETNTYSDREPPKISASAAIVLDTVSGRILYEKMHIQEEPWQVQPK